MRPLGNNPLSNAFASIYGGIVAYRNRWYDTHPGSRTGRPTIGVGCIHAGGTGKTPMALLVGGILADGGYEVAFLSRGYKRRSRKHLIVGPGQEARWEDVGDEPWLLRQEMPRAWLGIGPNRRQNASSIVSSLQPRAAFVLDDAFQHRSIFRDIDIVCLPADPFDGRLEPAGCLREPLSGLSRAHALCLVGAPEEKQLMENSRERLARLFPRALCAVVCQKPAGWVNIRTGERAERPALKKPALVSGIARPERFVRMVDSQGIGIGRRGLFGDHHVFRPREIEDLVRGGADGLVTTQKDACRLFALKLVYRFDIWYLKIYLEFSEKETRKAFDTLLLSASRSISAL